MAVVGQAEYVICPMSAEDTAAVLALEAEAPSAWNLIQLEEELAQPNGFQFVLSPEGSEKLILAYVCGRIISDEAEIMKLGVARFCRRKGIGSKLLDSALEYCRISGAQKCFLELRAANIAARRLYEKKGFVTMGIRKNYYDHPRDDAVVMQCEINNAKIKHNKEGQ